MIEKQISHAIKVVGCAGASPGNWTVMPDKEGKAFLKTVEDAFKKLMRLKTGRAIVEAINNSQKRVVVHSGDLANSGSGSPSPQSTASAISATVKYFLPRHQVQTVKQKGINPVYNMNLKTSVKKAMETAGAPTKKADTAPVFQRFIERAKAKYPDPVKMIAMLTGTSVNDINEMAAGTKGMPAETFFKICYHFYEYLEPGPGVDATVRFRAEPDIPDHILLGHEFIHAWRIMYGKRLVMGGNMFDEEAMTVGLGPFAGWSFTENQLRAEARLPRRLKYGNGPDASCGFVKRIQDMVEGNSFART